MDRVELYHTRENRGKGWVFVDLYDAEGGYCGVKKIRSEQYRYARQFRNLSFLSAVCQRTNGHTDRDMHVSWYAKDFIDPLLTYTPDVWYPSGDNEDDDDDDYYDDELAARHPEPERLTAR